MVMRPALLRPPLLGSGRTSDFSGSDRVTSTKSATDAPRRPGVVGLYLRIPMVSSSSISSLSGARTPSGDRPSEDVDGAVLERHDRALGVLAPADPDAGAAALALAVDRVDRGDGHAEDLLDRLADLGLVGGRVHDERVLALVEQAVALLRDDRREQDVARVAVDLPDLAHRDTSSSSPDVAAETPVAVAPRPRAGPATNASSAPWVKTTSSAHSTSYVFSWSAMSTCTSGRLRTLFQVSSSPRSRTSSTLRPSEIRASAAAAAFVAGT